MLKRERDANRIVVRHEELVARPYPVIANLYQRVGLVQKQTAVHAARLPERKVHDYSFIKYELMRNPFRAEILSMVKARARSLPAMTQLFQHSRAAACAMRQKDGSTICAPETIPNRVLRKVFSSHGRKGKDETSRHSHAPAS